MACEKQDYWTKVSLWKEEADATEEWSLASMCMLWHIPLPHFRRGTHTALGLKSSQWYLGESALAYS